MAEMENWILKYLNILGSSVCHQLPERSFDAGSVMMPVCSRCEGIYIGFFISAIILLLFFRKKESELPPLYIIIILAVFIASTVFDGFLSYASIIKTNNFARFITGYLAGSAAITIVYPVFNYQFYKNPAPVKIFSRPWQFLIFAGINFSAIALGLSGFFAVNYFLVYFSAISVIFTFYFVNLLIVLLIPFFSGKSSRLFSRFLVFPSIISILLVSLELFASYELHQFMLNLNAR